MNLKVVEWNVNGHVWKGRNFTEKYYYDIFSEITQPDVIVLTEYKKTIEKNKFENKLSDEYWVIDSCKSDNDILIAMNENTWENLEVVNFDFEKTFKVIPKKISKEMYTDLEDKRYPNLSIVKGVLKKYNTPFFIIGLRIKVSDEKDYKYRWNQLVLALAIIEKKIKKYKSQKKMKENEQIPIILAGDFNNSRYFGDINDLGKMVQKEYEDKEKAQQYYNLQKIKKAFLEYGYEYSFSTPLGNTNSVYSYGRVPCKLDHIFVRNLKVTSVKYSTEKYQSDHRMLIADVEYKK